MNVSECHNIKDNFLLHEVVLKPYMTVSTILPPFWTLHTSSIPTSSVPTTKCPYQIANALYEGGDASIKSKRIKWTRVIPLQLRGLESILVL